MKILIQHITYPSLINPCQFPYHYSIMYSPRVRSVHARRKLKRNLEYDILSSIYAPYFTELIGHAAFDFKVLGNHPYIIEGKGDFVIQLAPFTEYYQSQIECSFNIRSIQSTFPLHRMVIYLQYSPIMEHYSKYHNACANNGITIQSVLALRYYRYPISTLQSYTSVCLKGEKVNIPQGCLPPKVNIPAQKLPSLIF